jgi:hypothetical protein
MGFNSGLKGLKTNVSMGRWMLQKEGRGVWTGYMWVR